MSSSRRPIVAYTIPVFENEDDPRYCIYCDAYGLEMSIDDEWPIDTVLLTAPELLDVIMEETDVTSMGTVFAGASAGNDFAAVVKAKGTHVLLTPADDIAAGLIVILLTPPDTDLAARFSGLALTSENLVVALQPAKLPSPSDAQAVAAPHRVSLTELGCGDSRIVICGDIDESTINDYLAQPDVDGILLLDSSFDVVNELLSAIANS
ncbi:MAG: hypothetical protein WBD20_07995 [Pirellulaceae bacterium]